MKFWLIALATALLVAGGGFFLGWGHGRTAFANECITIGNFVVYDYGLEKHRRFICKEAEMEEESEKTNEGLRI